MSEIEREEPRGSSFFWASGNANPAGRMIGEGINASSTGEAIRPARTRAVGCVEVSTFHVVTNKSYL
jgi:hypothetical protein